ncbi:MAG: hypothetical protein P4L92_22420 [Rudaea sp.]|nr:hypothetical protein [Rudaea sp.]
MTIKYAPVSGTVFGVVAVVQATRIFEAWPVTIGTVEIPVWVSWVVLGITGCLCVWAFRSMHHAT